MSNCRFVCLLVMLGLASACAPEAGLKSNPKTPLLVPEGATASEETPPAQVFGSPRTLDVLDRVWIGSDPESPDFRTADGPLHLDASVHSYSSATLTVELDTTCFPFERWQDDPPPPGENWPASCDAFDRRLEVSLISPSGAPDIELVRAVTPFGGPMTIERDITDLVNGLPPGDYRVLVFISTSSDPAGQVSGSAGGWTVSASVSLEPGDAPRNVIGVVPLFRDVYGADSGVVEVPFVIPPGTDTGFIEYRATGHGGGEDVTGDCIGPADEFCRRRHRLSLDGQRLYLDRSMWRTNCNEMCTIERYGTDTNGFDFCAENPCGAISSVRAPRANWCPGAVTDPVVVQTDELARAGSRTFSIEIEGVAERGTWEISAVYYALGR